MAKQAEKDSIRYIAKVERNRKSDKAALAKGLVGIDGYSGLAYFWSFEYKHQLRNATQNCRKQVAREFLKCGLELNGESDWHLEIVTRRCAQDEKRRKASKIRSQLRRKEIKDEQESIDLAVKGCTSVFWDVYRTSLSTEEALDKVTRADASQYEYFVKRGRKVEEVFSTEVSS